MTVGFNIFSPTPFPFFFTLPPNRLWHPLISVQSPFSCHKAGTSYALPQTRQCVARDCYVSSEALVKLLSDASQQTDLSITSSERSSDQVGMWAAIAVEWERPCYVDHLNSPTRFQRCDSRVPEELRRSAGTHACFQPKTITQNAHHGSCSTIC
jgi:hypothetical protein